MPAQGKGVRRGSPRAELVAAAATDLSRILKATDDYSKHMQSRYGVSGPQLWALWELRNAGRLTVSAVAERMHLHPSTVSGIADRLEAKGLARRARDDSDHRVVRLDLTEAGLGLIRRAPQPARYRLLRALEGMPAGLLRALADGLADLARAMEAEADRDKRVPATLQDTSRHFS